MKIVSSNPLITLQRVLKEGSYPLKIIAIIGIFLATIGFILSYFFFGYFIEKIGNMLLIFAAIIWFYLEATLRAKEQAKIEENIEKAELAIAEHPDKARPLWDLARSRLELYFERNLSQIKSIFWITLVVMIAGFVMMGYGIIRAFEGQNINASFLSAASGILTEFIATTFLIIYKSTMNQASEYVRTLERINAVGMSIQIVDSIGDSDGELVNKVRADLVLKILDIFSKDLDPKGKK